MVIIILMTMIMAPAQAGAPLKNCTTSQIRQARSKARNPETRLRVLINNGQWRKAAALARNRTFHARDGNPKLKKALSATNFAMWQIYYASRDKSPEMAKAWFWVYRDESRRAWRLAQRCHSWVPE